MTKLKPAARRRMARAVTRLMPWDIQDREYYPPQAAVIDLAVRIALAVLDEGRDVEDITADENAELVQALVPIVQVARGLAEYALAQGPDHCSPEELASARACLDGRCEAELLDETRWAIARGAQMFAGANAPTTALQARKLVDDLVERRDRSVQRREKCAVDATAAHETKPGEGRVQTRVCAH
ncbi:hypothetical protein [Catenulispora yoronensis]|uniref:hypothetical protein n=1 Tax=Catenulispora yoronensis TaxID=450799 RepID=UPI0031D14540